MNVKFGSYRKPYLKSYKFFTCDVYVVYEKLVGTKKEMITLPILILELSSIISTIPLKS